MRIVLSLAAWTLAISPASANVYDDCVAAIEAGNQARAVEITKTIERFTTPPNPDDQVTGAECFTFATGKPHVYSIRLGAFVAADEEEAGVVEAQRKNAEEQKRQERLAAQRLERQLQREAEEAAAEQARIDRRNAVLLAVVEACHALYRDDPVSALTNEPCIEVFLESGLPE